MNHGLDNSIISVLNVDFDNHTYSYNLWGNILVLNKMHTEVFWSKGIQCLQLTLKLLRKYM